MPNPATIRALLVTGLLAAGLTVAGAVPAHAATPSHVVPVAQVQADSEKFYVVRSAYEGQPEYLYEIAQRFLADGERYPEIFELNKGRLQPDGQRMADPEQLTSGWVLQLPPDATGEGVETGPMPVVSVSAGLSSVAPATEAPAVSEASEESGGRSGNGVAVTVLVALALSAAAAVAAVAAVAVLLARRRPPVEPVPVRHISPSTTAEISKAAIAAWSQAAPSRRGDGASRQS